MLSILIPVFKFRVYPLLKELLRQGDLLALPFEILLYDDASGFDYSEEFELAKTDPRLKIFMLDQNLGRSQIRNRLAKDASYPWLLFMDADSAVISSSYLATYWKEKSENTILVGGTSYTADAPADQALYFRWYYGRNREQRTADERQQAPFEGFSTHQFFCAKKVFEKVSFPETLTGYGHEDTLFGFHLKEAGFDIQHLDNPLDHIGLEETEVYLKKTREALDNLHILRAEYPWISTRLSKSFDKLKRLKLAWMAKLFFYIFRKGLEKNIQSNQPSLLLFDLYRLGYFARQAYR